MAAINAARDSDGSSRPRSLYAGSCFRIKSRGDFCSMSNSFAKVFASGGARKYSTMTGSIPRSRNSASVARDLPHRGLW